VPASSSALGVLAIVAVLALAVAGLLTWGRRQPTPPPPPTPQEERPVLLVLPFEPLGGDTELAFLADALTEEVISHLGGRYPDQLAVIARTTTMRYRGTRLGVREIAQELGADFLLESSVRTEAGRVRVTAQLIDGQDASHLWAANYDRQPESLLEFQREVSQRIADTLAARLGATPPVPAAAPSPPPSWEGYLLYLKGLEALNRPTNPDLNEARELFRAAIREDPDFAPAHVALGRTLGPPAKDPEAALAQAQAALDRALALDPELPDAYLALGEFQLYQAFDLDAAKGSLDRALDLRPAFAEALHHRAAWFAAHGDTAGVRRDLDRARRLDPLSAAVRSDAGFFAYFDRRWDEALEQSVRTLELEPGYFWAQQCIALTLRELQRQGTPMDPATWQIRFSQPLADLLGAPPELPWGALLPHFWQTRWDYLQARAARGDAPLYGEMAVARMALDDPTAALAYLDQAAKTHSGWMVPFLGVHPLFQGQRSAS
jgi:serine/threonine-protein kinase